MKPSFASESPTARAQSPMPKMSWMTSTTGALSLRSGYTTKLLSAGPDGILMSTHSPWRGDPLRRSAEAALSGGIAGLSGFA
jgi:hypothetical protein